jgi:hypothetical protein
MSFWQLAKEEFAYVNRSYWMPFTFTWVLCTKGWPAAKKHFLDAWNAQSPLLRNREHPTPPEGYVDGWGVDKDDIKVPPIVVKVPKRP